VKYYTLVLICSLVFVSCGKGKLSERNAEKRIIEYMKSDKNSYPIAVTESFPTSLIYKKAPKPKGFGKITLCLGAKYEEFKSTYAKLVEKKLIETSLEQDGCTYMKANMTSEGQKYYIKKEKGGMFQDYSSHVVKTCELVLDEITGIKEIPEFNVAEVEFTLKQTNLTPFADVFPSSRIQKRKCTASFQKYNDGWRVSNIEGLPGQNEFPF
jgi:hypothetical protein